MTGPPVFEKFRGLAPERLAAAKQTFPEMEEMGLCQKASSPWSSPLYIILKKDGSLCPCGDYKHLIMQTEPDLYPLSNIADTTAHNPAHNRVVERFHRTLKAALMSFCKDSNWFTQLSWFLLGLRTTPKDTLDISAAKLVVPAKFFPSTTSSDNLQRIRHVPKILGRGDRPYNMNTLGITAADIMYATRWSSLLIFFRLKLLSTILSANVTLAPHHSRSPLLHEKLAVIQNFPTLSAAKALQEFFAMIMKYHIFPSAIAATSAVMYTFLNSKPKEMKKVSKVESGYSTFDRKWVAVHLALHHFHCFFKGTPLVISTEPTPLVHSVTRQSDTLSSYRRRHLFTVTEYNCTLHHVHRKLNAVADALSRNALMAFI
ncbi:uncharacterized protein [Palaemon carinicauda]|uniref:uncharacterized protein n=1 Tax=Palaemon carinicauda TaxID=392227 RepID=UPI0035B5AA45